MSRERRLSFNDSGDFLGWWLRGDVLEGKALRVFQRYYSNYRKGFEGYLKKAWAERHLELDRELEAIRSKRNLRIMDLGCGTGSVALYIAGRLSEGCEVIGVDIDEDRLFCARERQSILEKRIGSRLGCEFIEADVLSLGGQHNFDLIYLEETLHHLEPRARVIEKISSLLKNDAILIVSEVNAYNPFMRLHLLKRRGLKTVRKKMGKNGQFVMYGVERVLTARRVTGLFSEYGLKVKSMRYFRIASSEMGRFADKHGINLLDIERKICRMPVMSTIFSVHYNIVFSKEAASAPVN